MVRREVGSRNPLQHKEALGSARRLQLEQKLKPEIEWMMGMMAVITHTVGVL